MNTPALKILFEDNQLLAVNKPHGMIVEHDDDTANSLQDVALEYLRSKEKYPAKCFIGVPHRLDKAVSGLVLLTKKKSTLKQVSELFSSRKVRKIYYAIVEGYPESDEKVLINWLVKDDKRRKAIIYDKEVIDSSRIELRYKLIAKKENRSLLEIELITGKYHQIRAQLAHIGHPVIGDKLYGSLIAYKENAIALHSFKMELLHPATSELLSIEASPPEDDLWGAFKVLTS